MANEFIGRQVDFALAVEGSRGVAEAAADRSVRKVTCNLIPRSETVIDDTTSGRIEDAPGKRTVRKWSEGDVEGILHVDVLGYYLASIYGSDVVTGAGPTYSHAFTMAQTIEHPTLTGFIKDAEVRQEKVSGMVVSSLEISATTDDYVRYSAEFIGKEGATDTSVIPALGADYDFISRDIEVKIATTQGGLASATALKLKETTVKWDTNAEADFVFGSYSPDNIYNKQIAIEGSFVRNYTDTTFQDLYESDGEKFMSITLQGEANMGGGVNPKFALTLHKMQVTDWSRTSDGDDLVTEEVQFKAFLNVTSGEQSTAVLVNKTAEYIA